MKRKPFFSIAIPFYLRDENSLRQLRRCVNSIKIQSFRNYEIIISTQNKFHNLKSYELFNSSFIKLVDASLVDGFIQGNLNNAFKFCEGEWIKILFSDDYFFNKNDLQKIYSSVKIGARHWYVTNSLHYNKFSDKLYKPIIPFFHQNILELNTIGSPSAITIKNVKPVLFDKNTWMRLDVDYYYSLFLRYGKPCYIPNVFIVNEIHENQFSSLMINKTNVVNQKLNDELIYLKNKYNYKILKPTLKFIFRSLIKFERIILSFLFFVFEHRSNIPINILYKYIYKLFY